MVSDQGKTTGDRNEYQLFNRLFLIMILLSFFIHLCLSFLLVEYRQRFPNKPALVPQSEERDQRIEFELVDVPEDAQPLNPNTKTKYVSDRSATARDRYSDQQVPVDKPMSFGLDERFTESGDDTLDDISAERTSPSKSSEDTSSPANPDRSYSAVKRDFYESSFSSKHFLKQPPQTKTRQSKPLRKQTDTKALNSGGFSLNTYDWEFAPYLQMMKEKIRRNWYVPQAFRVFGIIQGETTVRFRVLRNGQVKEIELIKASGHESLAHSSVSAIKSAQPFKPLPDDFPEYLDYLEITATFVYINDKLETK